MASLLKCLHNSHEFNFWVTRCKYTDIRLDVTERSFTSSEVREKRGRKQCSFLLNAVGDISYSWGGIKSSLFHSVKISLILIPYREWMIADMEIWCQDPWHFPQKKLPPLAPYRSCGEAVSTDIAVYSGPVNRIQWRTWRAAWELMIWTHLAQW